MPAFINRRRRIAAAALVLTALPAAVRAAAAPAPSATTHETLSWADCVRESLDGSPQLREARHRLDATLARRGQSFGGFLPRLTASLSTGDSGSATPYFADLELDRYNARLSLNQSLFSGFATVADVRSAMADVRAERARLRDASADLRSRLRQTYVSVLYAQENVRVQEGIAHRRANNAALVRLRYEAGRENKGSALRAEADARQAAYEVARAKRALIVARQRLARDLGRDEFRPIEVAPDWTAPEPPAAPELATLAESLPAVIQARSADESARASVISSRAGFLPSADASASVGREGRDWPLDDAQSWSVGLSASWNLFNGLRDWYGLAAARARAAQAAEALLRVMRETRVSLQESWFAFQDAHENLGVQAQYLDAARARAEIGRAQYANGTLGFFQWDQIESDLVSAERGELAARRDALNAAASWDRATGVELRLP